MGEWSNVYDRQVICRIRPHELPLYCLAIIKDDPNGLFTADDMVIGDDVAIGIDNDS